MEMIEKLNDLQDIKLLIEKDGYAAYLQINTKNRIINSNEISDLINESGICNGFEQAKKQNERLNLSLVRNESYLIARGERGTLPQVEFDLLFNTEDAFNPEEFENDFKKLKLYDRVRSETPLANLFITNSGFAGVNIFGQEVGASDSQQNLIQEYLGENVYYSEDRSQIISTTAGYPYVSSDGRVNVRNKFIIDGNLDLNYESFELYGDLFVKGDIEEKIKLTIHGNLEVDGDINDAELHIDGSVKVKGDILNCPVTGIVAQGSVYFDSAENARIVSAKRISFEKNAHFCRLIAENGVYSEGENSSIVGGLIQSGNNIEVAIIGNSSQIGTEVEVTISPYTKERMLILTKQIMVLRERSAENASIIEKLEDELQTLENRLEKQINKALLSEDELPKHIIAFKKIFGGTYVRILKKSQTILEDVEKVSFTISQGELVYEIFE